jgi:hypothetical protein
MFYFTSVITPIDVETILGYIKVILSTNAKRGLFPHFSSCLSPADIIFALAKNLSKWDRKLKGRGLPQFLSRRHRYVLVGVVVGGVVVYNEIKLHMTF